MYQPGSRERMHVCLSSHCSCSSSQSLDCGITSPMWWESSLELELQRDKQERDAREREMRERELREMEFREKMKQELEMKPPGFDRLPPGAQLDPQWLELHRRYGGLPPGAQPGSGPAHIPGVYPPASLASDLMRQERERLERLDVLQNNEQLVARSLTVYQYYQRYHANMDPMVLNRLISAPPSSIPASKSHPEPADVRQADGNHLAYHFSRAAAAAAAAAGGSGVGPQLPSHSHQLIAAAREQELLYRDLLSRPPYNSDPLLAHQLQAQAAAHQEAVHRQLAAMERERLGQSHLPH